MCEFCGIYPSRFYVETSEQGNAEICAECVSDLKEMDLEFTKRKITW